MRESVEAPARCLIAMRDGARLRHLLLHLEEHVRRLFRCTRRSATGLTLRRIAMLENMNKSISCTELLFTSFLPASVLIHAGFS